MEPIVERPAIPAEYGASRASEFVAWRHIEERLAADRQYWIGTVGSTGRWTDISKDPTRFRFDR